MAFAYTHEENFENGSHGWSSEQDTNSVLNVRHFKRLAANYSTNLMPYRGAYALEVDLNGADTNQYLQHDTAFDLAASGSLNIRIIFAITSDLTMAASDRFTLFALQSTTPTDEVVIDIRNNSGTIEVLAAETGASATVRNADLTLGEWHTAELAVTIDSGGGDDGTVDFYLDGTQIGAQLASLDQGAIIQARLGVIGKDAGTTAGRVLINEIAADDARLFPYSARFVNPRVITRSQHLFAGPGWVDRAALLSTAADNVLKLYDTNTAVVNDDQGALLELDPDVSSSSSLPLRFSRGCYVELAGNNPRASVGWAENPEPLGVHGPVTLNDGPLRTYARSS